MGHKCKKINFQFDNEAGYLELLKLVQENMNAAKTGGSGDGITNEEKLRSVAFQVKLCSWATYREL